MKYSTWQLVSLVNHSGQNGMAFHRPVTMREIEVQVRTNRKVRMVEALRAGVRLDFRQDDGGVHIVLPELKLLETLKLVFN